MKYTIVAVALLLSGCAVGPNYKRPVVALPDQFRGAPAPAAEASIGDTKWENLFNDPVLHKLVETSLKQNFDLRIAAERVLQARAQLDSRRANLFPFIDGQGQWNATRGSTVGSLPFIAEGADLSYAYTQAGIGASWERSEEHTSELQSLAYLVCRLLLEKK